MVACRPQDDRIAILPQQFALPEKALVFVMAENKKKAAVIDPAEEKKLSKLLEKLDAEFAKEMAGRPYLLIATSGYPVEQEGDKATLAAQWSWRSNVRIGTEDSDRMVDFLTGQLKDVADHPEYGVKKTYKK